MGGAPDNRAGTGGRPDTQRGADGAPGSTANGGGASGGTEDGATGPASSDLPAGLTPPPSGRRLLGRRNKKR